MAVKTELFLYLAARAQLVREVIEPALKKGIVVISDRYEDSTIVYQAYAGGLPIDFVSRISSAARGKIMPEKTFLLDVSARTGLKRSGRTDRMEKKSIRFHERIRKGFLTLAHKNRNRFVVISSEQPKEKVTQTIKEVLDHAF